MFVRAVMTALFLGLACGGSTAEDTSPPQPSGGAGPTTPPGGAQGIGTLTGTVTFVGKPCPQPGPPPCDGAYPDYEVVVFAADGKTEVARTRTGADGTFSLELPEGSYAVFTQSGPMENDRARTDVTVSRDALSRTSLQVDTGIR
jgi:hypothetical protein